MIPSRIIKMKNLNIRQWCIQRQKSIKTLVYSRCKRLLFEMSDISKSQWYWKSSLNASTKRSFMRIDKFKIYGLQCLYAGELD